MHCMDLVWILIQTNQLKVSDRQILTIVDGYGIIIDVLGVIMVVIFLKILVFYRYMLGVFMDEVHDVWICVEINLLEVKGRGGE